MDLFLYHSSENSKDGLARNQDYLFEWSDMSTRGLLCQLASTIIIQPSTKRP